LLGLGLGLGFGRLVERALDGGGRSAPRAPLPLPAAALPFVLAALVALALLFMALSLVFSVLRIVVTESEVHVKYGLWGPRIASIEHGDRRVHRPRSQPGPAIASSGVFGLGFYTDGKGWPGNEANAGWSFTITKQ
jgi:hypothetical protein